jgi:hypothetical protein
VLMRGEFWIGVIIGAALLYGYNKWQASRTS